VKNIIKYSILIVGLVSLSACARKVAPKPSKPQNRRSVVRKPATAIATSSTSKSTSKSTSPVVVKKPGKKKLVSSVPAPKKMWKNTKPKRNESYNLSKPEPYSIESGQKDPEVLGPQTMMEEKDLTPVTLSKNGSSGFVEREYN